MTPTRYPLTRTLLLVLCLLLAGGCSMVRVGYGHLDTVAAWMAHDYFDLDAEQRDAFNQRFDRLHAWHRGEQLPEYARFVEDAQQRARRGLTAADMLWVVDGFRQRYARIAAHGAGDAADLMATLSPEQIGFFKQQIDKHNRKFLREHRTGDSEAERRKAAEHRTLSQLRDWVGSLSAAQEARIITLLQSVPLMDKLRREDHLRRQGELLALLELRRSDRAVFAQRLRDWLVHWENRRSPALARAFDESWLKRAEFYVAVDRLLTTEQRKHLLHRLQDYIDNFRELAARRPVAATVR